jgi:lysophospholipase L1-like esterase
MGNTRYLRFAALGDSTTCGIGDPVPGGWRGWARLLADALGTAYGMSFCNTAVSGATLVDVRERQLELALSHRPDLASLIVGVNDTMRSTWDPARIRHDLMECADALDSQGAVLMTARFHDHGAIFGLPGVLRRPLFARIEVVNRVYDEVYATYGGVRLDLGARPEIGSRGFWSVDRLHPSELGHRALANAYGDLLLGEGLEFELPALAASGGYQPSWRRDLAWMVSQGAPWVGRRARDLGPWAVRLAWAEARKAGQPTPL